MRRGAAAALAVAVAVAVAVLLPSQPRGGYRGQISNSASWQTPGSKRLGLANCHVYSHRFCSERAAGVAGAMHEV
jgi:hypothetical protein